jgi:hypothetical protein
MMSKQLWWTIWNSNIGLHCHEGNSMVSGTLRTCTSQLGFRCEVFFAMRTLLFLKIGRANKVKMFIILYASHYVAAELLRSWCMVHTVHYSIAV